MKQYLQEIENLKREIISLKSSNWEIWKENTQYLKDLNEYKDLYSNLKSENDLLKQNQSLIHSRLKESESNHELLSSKLNLTAAEK